MENKNLNKNWVSKQLLYIILSVTIVLGILAGIFHAVFILSIILGILSGLTFILFLYMLYAHYKLSPAGGDLQTKISELITDKILENAKGRLLDIGCGSGIISVKLALKCKDLQIDAIDYWGGTWGYSKEKCEALAKENGVGNRITFTKASASALPFADETFDIIISNMVFHEVADAKDKREVIKEALRTVKKGGVFILQDQFKAQNIYGKTDDLLSYVLNLGVQELNYYETDTSDFIPPLLNNGMFFGSSALIWGMK